MGRMLLRVAVCVVSLVVGIGSLCAAERPDWYPSDEVVAARTKVAEERTQAVRAYYEREWVGQYNKFGHRDPKWDQAALELIRAVISERVGDPDARAMRMRAVNRCVPLRPQDPMVIYLYARSMEGTAIPPETYRRALGDACDRVVTSPYMGSIRFYALCWQAQLKGTAALGDNNDGNMTLSEDLLMQALEHLDEIAKVKDLPSCEIAMLMRTSEEISRALYKDRWKWTSQVYDRLVRRLGERSDLLTAKAGLFVRYAWDARGDGWANTVTSEGWRLMKERLAVAEGDVALAWRNDPQCAGAAVVMLTVELGQGKGRDVMETWFRRAVALEPLAVEPYEGKRQYLETKWHGSDQQMLRFTREVAATLPKTAASRLLILAGHAALAHTAGEADPNQAEQQYFQTHPQAWREIKAVADAVVLAKDAGNTIKVEMARVASNAGDLVSARKYLADADDELGASVYGAEYARIKAVVSQGR